MNGIDRSEGFRVASSDGHVGSVEEVVYGAEQRPSALIISSGLFEKRLFLVAAENVAHVSHDREALFLSPSWREGAVDISRETSLVA